jgi:acid phosphatase family membrane protein YuiD
VIKTSTTITTDTTAINQVAAKDSTSLNAKIDSIIIEEYAVDRSELATDGQNGLRNLHGNKKRNDTSQKESIPPKRKTKIYGVNLSGTCLTISDSINKKMSHQATTNSEIKQKTPIRTTAGRKIIYVIVGITLLLFVGYVVWKNAVQ